MSKNSFYELLSMIEESIRKQDTVMRDAVPADQRLALTLRRHRVRSLTIHHMVQNKSGTSLLTDEVSSTPLPVTGIRMSTLVAGSGNLDNIRNQPCMVARTAGQACCSFWYDDYVYRLLLTFARLHIDCPLHHCLHQYCHQLYYRFLYIDVGAPGKASDSTTFKNTRLYTKLQRNKIKLPAPRPLSQQRLNQVPYVIIGDEGFGLSQCVLRPYGGRFFIVEKKVSNYRLTRARRYIECCFGILSNNCRIFHRAINVEPDFAETIIKNMLPSS
ncbi:hypothetical protein PR048_031323 [Dryococelus australis]|uniref:DDE Tnp4 domain-containing protein n=1 Tax=Dryococelus australis TaxID=614101 RepID=A0ABQ9G7P0_9NEOP|nr:hypothetical protein PR048_031323 [Dryococelus australis]